MVMDDWPLASLIIGLGAILVVSGTAIGLHQAGISNPPGRECPPGDARYQFWPTSNISSIELARILQQLPSLSEPDFCVDPRHPIPDDLMRQFIKVTP